MLNFKIKILAIHVMQKHSLKKTLLLENILDKFKFTKNKKNIIKNILIKLKMLALLLMPPFREIF